MKRTVAMVLLVSAFFGMVTAAAFAAPSTKDIETTKQVLEKMGQANEVGEYLATYTKLGNALDKVPSKVKKAKGFFDKSMGPLNGAVDAALLYSYVRDYKAANAATRGDIGKKAADKFFALLSPVINATPQGALINVSLQVGTTCYKSMMASVGQYQFNQAASGLYGVNAILNGGDYISESSPWYDLACRLFVDKVATGKIFRDVSNLHNIDPNGKYFQVAIACYKEGAGIDDITGLVQSLVDIDNLNARMAQRLAAAEAKQANDKIKAEEDKKKADAKRAEDAKKAALAKEIENNKRIIQTKCKFGNQQNVWNAIETHQFASDLYRVWAKSYPASNPGKKPNKPDKDIIQSFCKFGNPQAVWNAVAKHSSPNDLLKAWADSYYGLR